MWCGRRGVSRAALGCLKTSLTRILPEPRMLAPLERRDRVTSCKGGMPVCKQRKIQSSQPPRV